MQDLPLADVPLLAQILNSFQPESIFNAVLAFFWIAFLWDNYLSWRQRQVLKTVTHRPPEVAAIMDEETFTKSRLYSLDKGSFGLIHGFYSQIESTIFLVCGAIPWVWGLAGRHMVAAGLSPDREIIQSLVLILYVSLFSLVTELPWSYYYNFVIEERHGFNKQTVGFWVKDKIKGLAVSMAICLPLVSVLLWIIEIGGPYFYVYAWTFTSVFTFFMMFVYPSVIAPLFDRYEPLDNGDLRTKIEEMAASISFPLTKLYVVEGSKRSAHSNAYFYGFWKNKRIVLYDTLIEGYVFPKKEGEKEDETKDEKTAGDDAKKALKGCKTDEILAVLGHELGHWKMNHVNYNLLVAEVNLFLMFFLFGQMMHSYVVFNAFGFQSPAPMLIRLMLIFQFIFSPYNEVMDVVMTYVSRLFEFQADRFGVSMGRGEQLKTALVKLQTDNLSFPVTDWLYSAFNYSHPPLLERLRAIDVALAKRR